MEVYLISAELCLDLVCEFFLFFLISIPVGSIIFSDLNVCVKSDYGGEILGIIECLIWN